MKSKTRVQVITGLLAMCMAVSVAHASSVNNGGAATVMDGHGQHGQQKRAAERLCRKTSSSPKGVPKVLIGYVFSPAQLLPPEALLAEKLTHINYAFANLKNGQIVNGFDFDERNYQLLQSLKKRNPDLKILSSVGGWTWSGGFSDAVLTAASRRVLVDSAVAFVKRHQLDGIDIDWEYPGLAGMGNRHRPQDGKNFTLLLKSLRAAFDALELELGRSLLLTIATGGFPDYLAKSDISRWQRYLDYINIMAYDFNFPVEGGNTGHHTAFYSHPDDDTGQSADAAVRNHIAAGVPAHKLVLGVAFYGRHWTQVNAKNYGYPQPGRAGKNPYGSTSFNHIAPELINQKSFVRYWDELAKAPWLWSEKEQLFISYDDPQSLQEKTTYVHQQALAGMMFWQYASDYQHQLLNAIQSGLQGCR